MLLGALLGGCIGQERGREPAFAAGAEGQGLTPPLCLAHSPIDLSINLGTPPVSFYVNDVRLGYARGEAIFLSRPLCEMYGWPLCRFVEMHEQAHHYMKTVGQKSMCAETLADCWAAAHSDPEAVDAALRYFRGRHENERGYHADSGMRYQIISHCANLSDRELSEARGLPGGNG